MVDLSRLVIGYCAPAYSDPKLRQDFLTALFQAAEFNEPWTSPIPKSRETNVLLLLRGVANLFQDDTTLGGADSGAWANWVRPHVPISASRPCTVPFRPSCALPPVPWLGCALTDDSGAAKPNADFPFFGPFPDMAA